jgi:glycosyltransferase involved in cell wall biosynthesis
MMSKRDFSVLLSVYIGERVDFLREALQSIVNQTLPATQIVIIKDGALSMELDSLISEFESDNSNVLVVGYLDNKGLGLALSYGMGFVVNELVIRCDSDDINFPNRFEELIEFMTESNLDLVSSHVEEFENNPFDLGRVRKVPLEGKIEKNLYHRNPFNHMAVAFRKSAVLSSGCYADMKGFEDYYLWLRLVKNGYRVNNLDTTLVHARIGNDMIGRRIGWIYVKNEFIFQYTIYKEIHNNIVIFLQNIFLRCAPRLLPKKVLAFFYKKILRSETKN